MLVFYKEQARIINVYVILAQSAAEEVTAVICCGVKAVKEAKVGKRILSRA